VFSDGQYIEKEGIRMGNEWVSPYSPYLLKRLKCHINVEKCNNLNAIKYLYKYVYKGIGQYTNYGSVLI